MSFPIGLPSDNQPILPTVDGSSLYSVGFQWESDQMKTVASILEKKGRDVHTISVEASVVEALEIMAAHNVGALVVMSGTDMAGIVSERDYARRVELAGRRAADVPVSAIMTTGVITIRPEDRAESCLALMTERHIRHLPVVADGSLVGLVSIGDIVKAVISDLSTLVGQLERYIRGH
jgi:CBS domain-containing protein